MADEGKIDSVVGHGTVLKGDIAVNGSIKIDGKVEGSVSIKDSLIVGKGSVVKGDIQCKSAIVGGRIEGNITAQELVEFQEGVVFEGNCKMSQKAKDKE
jgi:cytoskeletal protein CcmA (bactofilin family)